MFYGDKDEVAAAVEKFRSRTCAYIGQHFCDCKYGGPSLAAYSEQTGCPELRTVLALLARLTPAEWNEILSRPEPGATPTTGRLP